VSTLWAPLEVADFSRSAEFYGGLLGLQAVEMWRRDGEQGAVYAADGASGAGRAGRGGWIEIVQPDPPTDPPAIALELADRAHVDRLYRRMGAAAEGEPRVFPRGHYGFVAADPDGNRILLWTEKVGNQ
jgi:predicted enzyme related to lactoylglutathione lyase